MTRDDFPFRNRYSPRSHKLCTDPLCLACLMAERDNYQLARVNLRTKQRLYIVGRDEEKKDDAA